MKKIILFKDKSMKDIFDEDEKVINVMTPNTFSAKKLGLPEKGGFLYNGFPMYLDRTVIHVRKEDKPQVDNLLKESVEQIVEISDNKLKDYVKKAKEDSSKEYSKNKNSEAFKKRIKGIQTATKKITKNAINKSYNDKLNESKTFKVGDDVHLGFGVKGGAGFIGKIEKLDGETVHIKHNSGKTYKGHVSKLSHVEYEKVKESYLEEKSPPSPKIEKWIKDNKAKFKHHYGENGEKVLYAKAWKMYKEQDEKPSILNRINKFIGKK